MDRDQNALTKARLTELGHGKYHEWRHRLLTYARAQKLAKYIEQDIKPPSADEKEEFDYQDAKALSMIHATIDTDNYQIIANCNTARSAFLALCRHHDDKGGLSTAMIFSKLVSMKLEIGEDLRKYLYEFRSLHNKLTGNIASRKDLVISDPFIAIILLTSLPSTFSALVQTMLTNFETISLERIYSLLSIEIDRKGVVKEEEETALVVKTESAAKKKKAYKKGGFNRNLSCSLGHVGDTDDTCKDKIINDLRKEVNSVKSGAPKNRDQEYSAKVAIHSSDDDGHTWEEAYHAADGKIDSSAHIIFDTGSTAHMFKDRKYLSDLVSIPPARIGVASKSTIVWAKMKGNAKVGKLNLTNVLYSPHLSSNLISIGKLCDQGYTASFQKDQGQVFDHSGEIVIRLMRSESRDRLWHPEAPGSCEIGSGAEVSE